MSRLFSDFIRHYEKIEKKKKRTLGILGSTCFSKSSHKTSNSNYNRNIITFLAHIFKKPQVIGYLVVD